MGRSGRGGLRFGQSGVWCGVRARVGHAVRARIGPGGWTLLLAVLTLQCAAKPYGLSSPGFCVGMVRPLSFVLLCVGFLLVAV